MNPTFTLRMKRLMKVQIQTDNQVELYVIWLRKLEMNDTCYFNN